MARVARRQVIPDISSFDRFEDCADTLVRRSGQKAGVDTDLLSTLDTHGLRQYALRELQTRTPAGQLRALAAALSSLQSNIAAERAKHQSMFVQGGTLTSEELLNRSCLQDLLLLGQVFASMGDAAAAAFCLRTTSFVIHDDPFPEFNQNRAVYDYCAYQCRRSLGDVRAAAAVISNHLAHVHRRFGRGQLDASRLQMQLALCNMRMGNKARALAYMQAALTTQQSALPPLHPQVVRTAVMTGTLQDLNGKHDQALRTYTAARDMIRASTSGEARALAEAQLNLRLGRVLVRQGRLHDAQDLLRDAHDVLSAALGGAHEKAVMARRTLNAVRRQLGLRDVSQPAGGEGAGGASSAAARRARAAALEMNFDFDMGLGDKDGSAPKPPASAPSLAGVLSDEGGARGSQEAKATAASSDEDTDYDSDDSDSDDDIFGKRGGGLGGGMGVGGGMGMGGMGAASSGAGAPGASGAGVGAASIAGSASGSVGGGSGPMGMLSAGAGGGSGPMGMLSAGAGGGSGPMGMLSAGAGSGSGPMGSLVSLPAGPGASGAGPGAAVGHVPPAAAAAAYAALPPPVQAALASSDPAVASGAQAQLAATAAAMGFRVDPSGGPGVASGGAAPQGGTAGEDGGFGINGTVVGQQASAYNGSAQGGYVRADGSVVPGGQGGGYVRADGSVVPDGQGGYVRADGSVVPGGQGGGYVRADGSVVPGGQGGGYVRADGSVVPGGQGGGYVRADGSVVPGGQGGGYVRADGSVVPGGQGGGYVRADGSVVPGGQGGGYVRADGSVVPGGQGGGYVRADGSEPNGGFGINGNAVTTSAAATAASYGHAGVPVSAGGWAADPSAGVAYGHSTATTSVAGAGSAAVAPGAGGTAPVPTAAVVRAMSRMQATEFGRVNATIEALSLKAEGAGGDLTEAEREVLRSALAQRRSILREALGNVPDSAASGSEALRQKRYDLGVEPETGESRYAYGDADSASEALADVTHNLASAVSGLLTAAHHAKQRAAAKAAAGDAGSQIDTVARWTSDGAVAFGSATDAAIAQPAAELTAALTHAIQSLAASNEVPDGAPGSGGQRGAQLEALRQTLFTMVADAGEAVQTVLKSNNIRTAELRVIAAAAAQSMVVQSRGGDGSAAVGGGGGGVGGAAEYGGALGDADAPALDPAKAAYGMKEALRRMREGEDAEEWELEPGQRSALRPGERPQRGLLRSEANPSGRRMKAVAMTATDILDVLKQKLLTVGLFRSLGSRKRQARTSAKVFAVGALVREKRMQAWRKWGKMVFALGLLQGAIRRRNAERRRTKLWLLGHLRHEIKQRQLRVVANKAFAVGAAIRAVRIRDFKRRCTMLFALGVFPMWKRTEGNPQGYRPPPKKKTKAKRGNLHWDTLGNVEGTIWEGAGTLDTRTLGFLFSDLKEMFTKKPVGKAAKGGKAGGAKKPKKPKKVEITFIVDEDGNRQQNMGIAVSRLKNFGFDRLAQALRNMDFSELPNPESALEIMLDKIVMPKPADVENAMKHESDKDLGLCERYIWHVVRVPNFKMRLECMQAKVGFQGIFDDAANDLDILDRACKEVTTSERLRRLLTRYVLPFGNALNAGTKMAAAKGVKLNVLGKLATTKTAKNPRMTMLDYLVSKIDQHEPELLGLAADFVAVKPAARVQEENINAAITKAKNTVELVQQSVEKASKENDEVFLDRMEQFAMDAGSSLEDLQRRKTAMEEDFAKTVTYIGEDPAKSKPDKVFTLVKGFCHTYNEAAMKYRADKERREAKERIEAAKAAKLAAKGKKPKRPGGAKPKKPPTGLAAGAGGAAAQ